MKIKMNLYIFPCIALFFITNQIEIYALIMIFALIHELAHLVCGVFLGFKPETFRIMPFGFSIEFKSIIEDYNKKVLKSNIMSLKKIIIASAGPIVNLLIVIVGEIINIDKNIVYSNFLLFIFNLLPIYPLDGGRIIKNVLKICFGNKKAYEYTNVITNVIFVILTMISSVLILLYKNISILALIIALYGLIIKENRRYFTYKKIYKVIDKNYN